VRQRERFSRVPRAPGAGRRRRPALRVPTADPKVGARTAHTLTREVTPVFEALQQASPLNKYKIDWVELAPVQFQGEVPKWLSQLNKTLLTGGPSPWQREALATEFLRLLHIQKQVLEKQAGPGRRSVEAERAKTNIDWFVAEYKRKFGATLKPPTGPESALDQLLDRQALAKDKLALLDQKFQLVNYWSAGVKSFPKHKEGGSLMFQYMGNAPSSKVRAFLEVLCADGAKAASLKDRITFNTSYETQLGLQTVGPNGKLTKVEWTDDRFKRTIKAEAGASYGARVEGAAELEFKGLKARLSGSAWAGALAKAQGEASYVKGQGVSASGSVEAEIAVRLKADLSIDCADIFLVEASAEAFAGAMARGEFEITATVKGVKVNVAAEAFAGAKLSGKAAMTLKIQGYEIVTGEATGSLTAGVGAKFGLTFESSLFDGAKFSLESGLTVGVGMDAGAGFRVRPDNLGLALHSLFYTAYLEQVAGKQARYTYKEYFRTLADNQKLFDKAKAILEEQMRAVITERNQLFSEYAAYRQLEGLAAFRQTGTVM
jgi:hypothetical protein